MGIQRFGSQRLGRQTAVRSRTGKIGTVSQSEPVGARKVEARRWLGSHGMGGHARCGWSDNAVGARRGKARLVTRAERTGAAAVERFARNRMLRFRLAAIVRTRGVGNGRVWIDVAVQEGMARRVGARFGGARHRRGSRCTSCEATTEKASSWQPWLVMALRCSAGLRPAV